MTPPPLRRPQEKLKGRNKLVPRLLGVTKEAVLRLDEKTKEILKEWPLTTVRRWAASPNTFTLGMSGRKGRVIVHCAPLGHQSQHIHTRYVWLKKGVFESTVHPLGRQLNTFTPSYSARLADNIAFADHCAPLDRHS